VKNADLLEGTPVVAFPGGPKQRCFKAFLSPRQDRLSWPTLMDAILSWLQGGEASLIADGAITAIPRQPQIGHLAGRHAMVRRARASVR
jgi:hypothetical protein